MAILICSTLMHKHHHLYFDMQVVTDGEENWYSFRSRRHDTSMALALGCTRAEFWAIRGPPQLSPPDRCYATVDLKSVQLVSLLSDLQNVTGVPWQGQSTKAKIDMRHNLGKEFECYSRVREGTGGIDIYKKKLDIVVSQTTEQRILIEIQGSMRIDAFWGFGEARTRGEDDTNAWPTQQAPGGVDKPEASLFASMVKWESCTVTVPCSQVSTADVKEFMEFVFIAKNCLDLQRSTALWLKQQIENDLLHSNHAIVKKISAWDFGWDRKHNPTQSEIDQVLRSCSETVFDQLEDDQHRNKGEPLKGIQFITQRFLKLKRDRSKLGGRILCGKGKRQKRKTPSSLLYRSAKSQQKMVNVSSDTISCTNRTPLFTDGDYVLEN